MSVVNSAAELIPNSDISRAFVQALPKTDLHVHLDGSLRLSTLISLAREAHFSLPSYEEAGLRELVFKDRYQDLRDYLQGFAYTVGVLQSEGALEQAAYELALDNQAEGVRYIEVRFAPQLHVHHHMSTLMVLKAVNRGLKQARDAYNRRPEIVNGYEPPFEYGIICCAMRMFQRGFSEYFTQLLNIHRYAPLKSVYSMAALELVRAAVLARDEHGLPVVGLDLAGEEHGYPAEDYVEAFQYAHKNFLKKTVHAGEAYGPESIFQAITDLYADRIGHGTYLLKPEAITAPQIVDKGDYVKRLSEYIADRRITLEICLTSNLQTNAEMNILSEHTFKKMREHRLSTTICTDNRTISNTTVTNELAKAIEHLNLNRHDLKSIIIYGFKRSFFPGSYLRKRQYVREIIDFYEKIESQELGKSA